MAPISSKTIDDLPIELGIIIVQKLSPIEQRVISFTSKFFASSAKYQLAYKKRLAIDFPEVEIKPESDKDFIALYLKNFNSVQNFMTKPIRAVWSFFLPQVCRFPRGEELFNNLVKDEQDFYALFSEYNLKHYIRPYIHDLPMQELMKAFRIAVTHGPRVFALEFFNSDRFNDMPTSSNDGVSVENLAEVLKSLEGFEKVDLFKLLLSTTKYKDIRIEDIGSCYIGAGINGNVEILKLLHESKRVREIPHFVIAKAIECAIEKDHKDVVAFIIKNNPVEEFEQDLLGIIIKEAAYRKNLPLLNYLLVSLPLSRIPSYAYQKAAALLKE